MDPKHRVLAEALALALRPWKRVRATGSPFTNIVCRSETPRARALPMALLAPPLLAALIMPAAAESHSGNPNYESTVRAIQPRVPGLEVQVLNNDDRLELVNRTGEQVDIAGYEREPYARLLADGTVEVNKRSPSYYLNEDRYGEQAPPPSADAKAPPQWAVLDKTGRFEWHDHRIHYMSKGRPAQVTDEGQRTKVFDWRVPIEADGRTVSLRGDLYWVPDGGGIPRGALLALAAFVFATVFFVELVRRRRRRASGKARKPSEAWG
jgi:hypothetical protein